MFDLFREILLLAGFAHLVVAAEIRFSALRPEPEIKEKENYQPGKTLFYILKKKIYMFL